MQLVGMLDSPYVRRVAISLQRLGIPFQHRSISVFRGFEQMRAINPVVKVPTLVCDDGQVLMESSLILDYAEALAAGRATLMPTSIAARQNALHLIGLGLAACEKSVSILYERVTRPPEKAHQPWVDRLTLQLLAAYDALEAGLERTPIPVEGAGMGAGIDQAGITAAVAWFFTQAVIPEVVEAARYPRLARLSADAEGLPEFIAAPHGDGTCPVTG